MEDRTLIALVVLCGSFALMSIALIGVIMGRDSLITALFATVSNFVTAVIVWYFTKEGSSSRSGGNSK